MSPIIHSLLDTDLYKFTMLQVVLHQFPQTHSVYHFRCRNLDETQYPLTDILDDLNEQLDHLCTLKFKDDELQYLRSFRFIKSDFVDYLELFQLKRRFITAGIDEEGRLDIWVEGPMVQAMMFEIFVLAIVNELYFRRIRSDAVLEEGERRLQAKLALLEQYQTQHQSDEPPFLVSDFGTRRRYSFEWQKHVIAAFHHHFPNIFREPVMCCWQKNSTLHQLVRWHMSFCKPFRHLMYVCVIFRKLHLKRGYKSIVEI